MMAAAIVTGLACAACFALACHAPADDRRIAVALAIGLIANRLAMFAAWSPLSPSLALHGLGLPVCDEMLWAVGDGLLGMLAMMLGNRVWFGWAIWTAVIYLEVVNGLASLQRVEFDVYRHWLDYGFWAIVAVFACVGGGGVWTRVRRDLDRLRHAARAPLAAKTREAG